MNDMVGTFLGWLLRASWQAAVLVLLIFLVQSAFRKKLGAQWRYALWLLVVARLVLPVSPHSALSVFNYTPVKAAPSKFAVADLRPGILPAPQMAKTIGQTVADERAETSIREQATSVQVHDSSSRTEQPAITTTQPQVRARSIFKVENIGVICAVIWVIGVMLLTLRLVVQNLAFIRGLRGATRVTETKTLELFEECRALLGVRVPIGLVEADEVKSPALRGLFRPSLLLPRRMIGGFSQRELRYIFLHELAHVKRGDMAVHWAATWLRILHWFNPVLWFGFRRMAADRELACDEMALSHAGDGESKPYGEAILKVLEVCAYSPSLAGVMGILESRDQMTQRIAMILKFKRRARWSLPALILLIVLGLVTLTDARGPAATEAAPNSVEKTPRPDLTGHVQTTDGKPVTATVFIYTAGPKTGTSTFCPSCYLDCRKRAKCDEQGEFKIESLDPQLVFRILVVAAGYEPKFVAKVDPAREPIVVKLKASGAASAAPEGSLHGRVVDAKGDPVEGAVVYSHGIHKVDGGGLYGSLPGVDPLAVTDAKGEFLLTSRDAFQSLDVKVEARGLANKTFNGLSSGRERHDLVMNEGATVTGRVMLNSKPLANVSVGIVSEDRGPEGFTGNFEVGTDAEGRFAFMNLPPNVDYYIYGMMNTVKKYGAIPATTFHAGKDGETTGVGDLAVVPGHRLAGRVVLSDGSPVPAKTRLLVDRDEAWDSMELTLDKDGNFDTQGIPSGAISLSTRVTGYRVSAKNASLDQLNPFMLIGRVDKDITNLVFLMEKGKPQQPDYNSNSTGQEDQPRGRPLHGSESTPDYDPHAREWALSGRVTDAETHEVIGRFNVIPGNNDITWDQTHWDTLHGAEGTNGDYTIYIDKRMGQPVVQVKADGYLPASVPLVPMQTKNADVTLKKGKGPEGTVLSPDGQPAANVSVLLVCRDDQNMSLSARGELRAYQNPTRLKKTDAAGHFSFAPELGMRVVLAASPDGYKQVSVESLQSNATIGLEAYGRITGTLKRPSGPGKKEDLDVEFVNRDVPIRQRILLQNHTVTDDEGRFEFKDVPPGPVQISYRVAMNGQTMRSWQNKPLQQVTVKSGETLEVNIQAADPEKAENPEGRFPRQQEALRTGEQLKGKVLLPNGKPAADAQVGLQVEGKYLALGRAVLKGGGMRGNELIVRTDADGGFTLPMFDKATAVIAVNEEGFAKATPNELNASPQMKLQAWGRVEGTLHIGKKLGTNQTVVLSSQPGMNMMIYDFGDFLAQTDAQGRFVITFVPPGEQRLARLVPLGDGSQMHQRVGDVMVKAGGVTRVDVGGTGETVIGKVKLPETKTAVDWKHLWGTIHNSFPKPPEKFAAMKKIEERMALKTNEEYQAYLKMAMKEYHNYPVMFSADGSFTAEEVPPGKYELDVQQLNSDDDQIGREMVVLGHCEIVVSAAGRSGDAPVDLGLMEMKAPKVREP